MSGEHNVCPYCHDDLCPRAVDFIDSVYEGKAGTALVDAYWLEGKLIEIECLKRQVERLKGMVDETED